VPQNELLEFAKGIASKIMRNSPVAIGQAIKAVNANFKESFELCLKCVCSKIMVNIPNSKV
jgi:enoyl-CoA hydratase/carnithine racemase